MRGNEKEFKETRLIIVLLAVIIILLFGIIILLLARGDKPAQVLEPNKVEKKDNEKTTDNTKEEKSEEEEKKQVDENDIEESSSRKSTFIDVSNECFNSGKCTKEISLSNGEKNITVKVMFNGTDYYIFKGDEELLSFRSQDPNMGVYIINKIAYLDTEHLVIEKKSSAKSERYYFDSKNNLLKEIGEVPYDTNYRFTSEITDKETNYYVQEQLCDKDGKYRTVHEYLFKIIDNENTSDKYKSDGKTECAGQS